MAGAELPDELPEGWIERSRVPVASRGSRHDVRARRTAGPRRRRDPDDRAGRARAVPRSGPGGRVTARTKLVCTLGPARATPQLVRALVEAGTSIFRINCLARHARGSRAFGGARPRRRGGHGHGARRPRGSARAPRSGSGPMRPGPVPVQAGPAVRAPSGRRRMPRAPRRPIRGSPRTSARATGCCSRTARSSSRSSGSQDGIVELSCVRGGTVRSGQGVNVPAERLEPAGRHRSRPGGPRARARAGRRSRRAVVRARSRRHHRAPRR